VVVLALELLRDHEQRAALDPTRSAGVLPRDPGNAEVQQHDVGVLGSPNVPAKVHATRAAAPERPLDPVGRDLLAEDLC
jgi:hypothetical protein